MTDRPLILVANDDGIEADGLWHLAAAMQAHGDVVVAAPAANQSGMSAAFTLHRELTAGPAESRLDGVPAFMIDGTPTDAVVHGLRSLKTFAPQYAGRRVALLVSGVNPGPNVGRELLHSGTVMAAMQGYLRRLPAVAVSLASFEPDHLADAAAVGADIAARLLASGDLRLLNVNLPDRPRADLTGLRICRTADLAASRVLDIVTPAGGINRQLSFSADRADIPDGTDIAAVMDGAIAVTPLDNDLTNHQALTATANLLSGL